MDVLGRITERSSESLTPLQGQVKKLQTVYLWDVHLIVFNT